jgi:uncharacterized protein (DUF302 family)
MNPKSINLTLNCTFETGIERVTETLKQIGFGILTRIDFDQKIKEKLGHTLPRTAILGACNPSFAYEAYTHDRDMLLLVPCNVVIEETSSSTVEVRMVKPSILIEALNSEKLLGLSTQVDQTLENALRTLS